MAEGEEQAGESDLPQVPEWLRDDFNLPGARPNPDVIQPGETYDRNDIEIQFARPDDYKWASKIGLANELEKAERTLVAAIGDIAGRFDQEHLTLLSENSNRIEDAQRVAKEFDEAIHKLNPKQAQITDEKRLGSVEVPRSAVVFRWNFCDPEVYRQDLRDGHYSLFRLRHRIDRTTLMDLHRAWFDWEDVRRRLGLTGGAEAMSNRSPYLWAQERLEALRSKVEADEIPVLARRNREPFDFGEPTSVAQARKLALTKAALDEPYAITMEKFDPQNGETYREVTSYTVDPEARIQFSVTRRFLKKGHYGKFTSYGAPELTCYGYGPGPHGEIYHLTSPWVAPVHYSNQFYADQLRHFKPYYYDSSPYSQYRTPLRMSEVKEIDLWRAFCRSVCDEAKMQDEYRLELKRSWDYSEIYLNGFGPEVEQYHAIIDGIQIEEFLETGTKTAVGPLRFAIWRRGKNGLDGNPVPAATDGQILKLDELFGMVMNHPSRSQVVPAEGIQRRGMKFSLSYVEPSGLKAGYVDILIGEKKVPKGVAKELFFVDRRGPFTDDGPRSLHVRYIKAKDISTFTVTRGNFAYVDGLEFGPRDWYTPEESHDSLKNDEAQACITALALHLQQMEKGKSEEP